jgi:signal transduction histidine kinase
MKRTRQIASAWVFGLVVLLLVPDAWAQRSTHVRVFRASGTYPANLTVSASGSVLSRSADSPNILILDGYTRREVAPLVETPFRVYQSRSAQLWSVTRDGLQLYHQNEWTLHPITQIRNDLSVNPIRQLRQISLLPAEVNHVLILLSDKLLDYQSDTGVTRVLKDARDTRLGEFLEIQEGAEESVWISGTYGFAHIPGPTRRITPESPWTEYILPDTNLVNTLQRPSEFPRGTVTASANAAGDPTRRFIVQLANERFTWLPITEEKIKQAWTGWDEHIWAYSSTTLFRVDEPAPLKLHKEPVSGAQFDMSCETNGVFWIASSEGLVRYAPHLWRAPTHLERLQVSVHALGFDHAAGVLWAATPEGLVRATDEDFEVFSWPEGIEGLVQPRDNLFLLMDGRVLIGGETRPLIFLPNEKRFFTPEIPAGVQVHLLGELGDGAVAAWFEGKPDEAVDLRRFNGNEFEEMSLPEFTAKGTELLTLRQTSRGDLWIGTSSGLIFVRVSDGIVEHHGREQGLPNERVTAVVELGEGRTWCGTSSRVYEYVDRRWELRLTTPERVSGIVSALGSVWVGTPTAVYRSIEGSWMIHRSGEGIHGGGVYTLKLSPENEIWGGTSRGLVRFHPDADRDPPRTLPPIVQDQETPSTVEPTMVTFRGYDKWDYTLENDLFFSYRLDEAPWTPYSNISTRVFQNLSSGTHVIEVRAMDRNGNESVSPSRVEFAVIVPWFQDPRLLAVSIFALGVTLVFAAYAVRKHFELKRSYAEVEKIVRQRTGELERANQELLHSQKMRAIGTMAAGIAHDFNNILSIIRGSAQIIEGNVDDKEKIKTRVDRIQTVVEQGTSIVKALLGLGRMNEQELSACDLGELLRETKKLLGDRFSAEVKFELDVGRDLPEAVCSHEVLQQMLLNFILNAVEAMGGKGLVRLSAHETRLLPSDLVLEPASADCYVILTVADEGAGIPQETLPRIFEPFFTTKAFSSRRGTGLGLSMVYELAKGLGYGVAVRSALGEGSSFSILLPLKQPPKGASAGASKAKAGASGLESRR